jgi:hypothetical protein
MTYLHTPGIRQDGGPEHIEALSMFYGRTETKPAGLMGVRTIAEMCERRTTANVYRMLAIATRSLRYWSEGFEHDDEEANTWREHYASEVDQLLAVLKARGE